MAALLIGAPKVCKDGPNVRLLAGNWNVKVRGLIDSVLHLVVGDDKIPLASGDHKLTLSNPSEARVEIHTRGTENCVSIIAQRVK